VHHPVTGVLLGAIDVTGGDHVASPHVLTLVKATAAAAESELRWLYREHRAGPVRAPVAPRLQVLGRDRALLGGDGAGQELSLRHSELLFLLAEAAAAGEGRTAEQLAAEVHGAGTATVTVRAELSRLRRLVGPDLLDSRPYRLLVPVRSDADEVRRLLARGSVGAALERYPGPLLPRSTAPGVRAARARLSTALRQAVLTARRPELLARYSALPEVADDVGVWLACRDALPTGSARWATAVAQLQRLGRQRRR
jgi:hypothetical protein